MLTSIAKQASGELYKVSGMSFIKVYTKKTTGVRFFLSHGFWVGTNLPLDKLPTGFLNVLAQVI